jgi:two-component system nitrate/nitrite response regulator NarL
LEHVIATVVIEARALIRESLISLMTSHSYNIVGSFASTVEVHNALPVNAAPELVILGALPADRVADAESHIRERWPATKIVLLLEHVSSTDCQKLLASGIDGCMPLLASPDTLMRTLQQIIMADLRILVLKTEPSALPCPTGWQEKGDELNLAAGPLARGDGAENAATSRSDSLRIVHGLSQREEEILKSVVRGHSNKMIARTCGVADATIKVHMKSILRKIRVANRTQAAIWALERGYGADGNRSPAHQGLAAA